MVSLLLLLAIRSRSYKCCKPSPIEWDGILKEKKKKRKDLLVRGVHGVGWPGPDWTWTLKLGSIDKWSRLRLSGIKFEAQSKYNLFLIKYVFVKINTIRIIKKY